MKLAMFTPALLLLQLPISGTRQITQVLPNHPLISPLDRGHLVQLKNEPESVYLPVPVPSNLSAGAVPWFVDVSNLGPQSVTLKAGQTPVVTLRPKETAHIVVRGSSYVAQK